MSKSKTFTAALLGVALGLGGSGAVVAKGHDMGVADGTRGFMLLGDAVNTECTKGNKTLVCGLPTGQIAAAAGPGVVAGVNEETQPGVGGIPGGDGTVCTANFCGVSSPGNNGINYGQTIVTQRPFPRGLAPCGANPDHRKCAPKEG